jgi:hypothetical protein
LSAKRNFKSKELLTSMEGKRAKGKREFEKFKKGEKLTYKQSVYANCYECMSGYYDGKVDCEVKNCPLYTFIPFVKP